MTSREARANKTGPLAGRPKPPGTIAELVLVSCLLLAAPGAILFGVAVALVATKVIPLEGNLLLPMLLALWGFGLFVNAITGLTATCLHGWRRESFRGIPTYSLILQGGIICSMIAIWCSGWQIHP
ncbi:hypothetical protein [Planctomicrobium sp. SH527]|uniref:hypothetical protein n=1 Tax=Planctomicrobium sp. SH527 TaxID=3448123 RepID=UPI003F5C6A30